MKEYKVRIEEINTKTVIIKIEDDKSEEDINDIVENLYGDGTINLNHEDSSEIIIEIQGVASKLDKELFENYDSQSVKSQDLVTIICYGTLKTMERKQAKELYLDYMLNSEGAEKDRYSNIYRQLMAGESYCSDEYE